MTLAISFGHRVLAAASIGASLFLFGGTASAIPVQNASFDDPWPGVAVGEPATTLAVCTPTGAVGHSASEHWTTYANTSRTDINSWIADSPDGFRSNLVAVGGGQDGLVQVLAPQCTTTDVNRVSGWFYVLGGQAALQLGNGGAGGGTNAVTHGHGQWEFVQACARPDLLNNEITIYGVGPAVFYVDDVSVDFTEECLVCAHSAYDSGKPLQKECGTCEAKVCEADPYCCETGWDDVCVAAAHSQCAECPLDP